MKNTPIPSHYTSWLIGFPTMGYQNHYSGEFISRYTVRLDSSRLRIAAPARFRLSRSADPGPAERFLRVYHINLLGGLHWVRLSSIYLSIHLSIYPSIHLCIYLSIHLSIYLSIYRSMHLSIYPSIYLSIHPSIQLYIYQSIHLSIHLPTYPSIHLCIYLSI